MRAGKLRTAAKIQQNTPTRDSIGGEIASWSDYVATWYCRLEQVKGGQMLRGRVVHAQAELVASGRYVAGVTTKMRVTLGGRILDILAVNNIDSRDRELDLELQERNV
jgi:SPP1 family predicted phage head-tail adaptor